MKTKCIICGKDFEKKRYDMICCSVKCRKKLYRNESQYSNVASLKKECFTSLWTAFKKSSGYIALEKALLMKKSECKCCVWGASGVCIRPKCNKK